MTAPRFDALRDFLVGNEVGAITYYSLASGFLTGKYRSSDDLGQSPRGGGVASYLNDKGHRLLRVLDQVAAESDASMAEVALAWLVAQKSVSAPIASATSVAQVQSLAKGRPTPASGCCLRPSDRSWPQVKLGVTSAAPMDRIPFCRTRAFRARQRARFPKSLLKNDFPAF